MKTEIYILNHKTRDPSQLVDRLKQIGRQSQVSTDETDYYLKRNEKRYVGLCDNYFGILRRPWNCDYRIIVHDDIVFEDNAFDNIDYILSHHANGSVSFFNNARRLFSEALDAKHHVVSHYRLGWTPCVAWSEQYAKPMLEWIDNYTTDYGKHCHEVKIQQYACAMSKLRYIIAPSLIQHEGYDKSIFKNPAEIGGVKRQSKTYIGFDARLVDWNWHFNNPYRFETRAMYTKALKYDYERK